MAGGTIVGHAFVGVLERGEAVGRDKMQPRETVTRFLQSAVELSDSKRDSQSILSGWYEGT